MPRPPPMTRSAMRAVVLSLYRTCLRWTQLPLVERSKFLAGDHMPPALAALQLPPRLLTNKDGIREAIRTLFRANAQEKNAEVLSEKVNMAFEGLQYLNRFTGTLENAEARREANRNRDGVTFRIGQVVRHKLYNYRAIIVGWDKRPMIDVSNWEGVVQSTLGVNQPFYHCIPDSNDTLHFLGGVRKLMYVAQENLKMCHALESRIHSDVVPQAFEYYDTTTNSFIPTERIAWQYPLDLPSSSPTSSSSSRWSASRRFKVSVQRANLVDASRRLKQHLHDLSHKIWQHLEVHFGVLERFSTQEPLGTLLSLLTELKEMDPFFSSSLSSSSSKASITSSTSTSTSTGTCTDNLNEVLPGYDALRVLRDLLAFCEDAHSTRKHSNDKTNVHFHIGQVVRHPSLGYRGVISGWEKFPRTGLPSDPPSLQARHPYYRVIVNDLDRDSPSTPAPGMVVLPQEMLEATAAEESAVVVSPLIPDNFLFFDPMTKTFQPNAMLKFKYPDKEEGGVEGGRDGGLKDEKAAALIVETVLRVLTQVLIQAKTKLPRQQQFKTDLFIMLQGAMRKEDAEVVESCLWSLWLAHPEENVRRLMDDGVQFMLRAKYDLAVARFDAALAADGEFIEAGNKRGTAHFLAGRYEEARRDVEATLSREPLHWGALLGKGLIYYEQGQKVQAIKAFRATLRIHPWSTNVGTTLFHTRKQLEGEEAGTMAEHP